MQEDKGAYRLPTPEERRQLQEDLTRHRARVQEQARERGLKELRLPNGSVWVEPGDVRGAAGQRFFTVSYREGAEPSWAEHQIRFPLRDFQEFIAALKELDQLYFAAEDTVHYSRYGVEGLVEFLEEISQGIS